MVDFFQKNKNKPLAEMERAAMRLRDEKGRRLLTFLRTQERAEKRERERAREGKKRATETQAEPTSEAETKAACPTSPAKEQPLSTHEHLQ